MGIRLFANIDIYTHTHTERKSKRDKHKMMLHFYSLNLENRGKNILEVFQDQILVEIVEKNDY